MKQQITNEQYKVLSDASKTKWYSWAKKKNYGILVNPTIGEMIEFLGKNWFDLLADLILREELDWSVYDVDRLCDMLWLAVKEKLECDAQE